MTELEQRLAACAGDDGFFRILAIDHRDSIVPFLSGDVDRGSIVNAKRRIVAAVPTATAVMLDPDYGIPDVMDSVGPGVAVIAALEAQGYLSDQSVTHTTLQRNWGSLAARRAGATGVKFLALCDPSDVTDQLDSAGEAIADAHAASMPIFLEPLWRGPRSHDADAVVAAVQAFAPLRPDVLKLPFPAAPEDARLWASSCERVSDVADGIPWVVLSAGAPIERFASMLSVAIRHGCRGFMAGRTLWHDDLGEGGGSKTRERFEALASILGP